MAYFLSLIVVDKPGDNSPGLLFTLKDGSPLIDVVYAGFDFCTVIGSKERISKIRSYSTARTTFHY